MSSGKETVVSRVASFKGKLDNCGSKLGEKSKRRFYLCFLGVTFSGCKGQLVQGNIKII